MTGGDGRLQGIKAARAGQFARPTERQHPPPDLQLVPQGAVLVRQKDRLADRVGARRHARGVELHQGQQPMGFGFVRCDYGEHAAQAERLVAELRPQPVLAARGSITSLKIR